MSEFLTEDGAKQEALKKLIRDLHGGLSPEDARRRFAKMIKDASAQEIAAMEQALIDEGMPPAEITRLCDVHQAVFEKALKRGKRESRLPGHPIHTYQLENRAAKPRIKAFGAAAKRAARGGSERGWKAAAEAAEDLGKILVHYARKENQLFPLLEARGFTGPSKVMWAKHDEVRALFKAADAAIVAKDGKALAAKATEIKAAVLGMIFKEERILFPAAAKRLSEADWVRVRKGEGEIGYAWVNPGAEWEGALSLRRSGGPSPAAAATAGAAPAASPAGAPSIEGIDLSTGKLSAARIDMMLRALPVDLSYVDEHDRVLYYSDGAHRVFPRSPAIIGRAVQNCHPPKSVAAVERIIADFRAKKRAEAEFWLNMGGRMVHIRYYPVYDGEGEYRGTIEVSQDVTGIRALQGEKRLLEE